MGPPNRLSSKDHDSRTVILKTHLYLGLVAAIFLVILGLTGSIMAFEGDINHWLHPELWYVTPGAHPLPENDLISIVQHRFPRARVAAVQFFRAPNLVQVMQLTDGTTVYVNPYDGAVLGETVGPMNSDLILGYIHQLHLRLVPVPRSAPQLAAAGKTVVSFAGLILCPDGRHRADSVVAPQKRLDQSGKRPGSRFPSTRTKPSASTRRFFS